MAMRVRFVARYGWRAYALPVLSIVTIAALTQPHRVLSPAQAVTARSPTPQQASQRRVRGTESAQPTPITVLDDVDSTACLHNTAAGLVIVSISRQHVWMCEGPRQVNFTAP